MILSCILQTQQYTQVFSNSLLLDQSLKQLLCLSVWYFFFFAQYINIVSIGQELMCYIQFHSFLTFLDLLDGIKKQFIVQKTGKLYILQNSMPSTAFIQNIFYIMYISQNTSRNNFCEVRYLQCDQFYSSESTLRPVGLVKQQITYLENHFSHLSCVVYLGRSLTSPTLHVYENLLRGATVTSVDTEEYLDFVFEVERGVDSRVIINSSRITLL